MTCHVPRLTVSVLLIANAISSAAFSTHTVQVNVQNSPNAVVNIGGDSIDQHDVQKRGTWMKLASVLSDFRLDILIAMGLLAICDFLRKNRECPNSRSDAAKSEKVMLEDKGASPRLEVTAKQFQEGESEKYQNER